MRSPLPCPGPLVTCPPGQQLRLVGLGCSEADHGGDGFNKACFVGDGGEESSSN